MPENDNKIWKYKYGINMKFICVDIEPLIEKIDTFHNNPKRSWTTKNNKIYPMSLFIIHYRLIAIKQA